MLDLPENLISIEAHSVARASNRISQQELSRHLRAEAPDSSSVGSSQGSNFGSHITSDFLRGATNTRPLKFMNIFLEVLRVLSMNKLICLCLDDLHNADEESLDLISNIMSRKLRIALIVGVLHEYSGVVDRAYYFHRSHAVKRKRCLLISLLRSTAEVRM